MEPKLTLFNSQSGYLSARVDCDNDKTIHLHSIVEPQKEYQYFTDVNLWGDVLIFLGTGLGYHFGSFLKTLHSARTIILVDYFEECLHHTKTTYLSNSKNDIILIDLKDYKKRVSDIKVRCASKKVQVIRHAPSIQVNPVLYNEFLNSITNKKDSFNETNQKNKILLFYGDFFCEEELRRALQKKDSLVLFPYKKIISLPEYESTLLKLVETENISAIFSVNFCGFDGMGVVHELAKRKGIPIIVWFVDDPRPIIIPQQKFLGDHIIACTWEKSFIQELKNLNFLSTHHVPLAADESLYRENKPSNNPKIPLAFVGSSMGESFLRKVKSNFLWQENLQFIADKYAVDILKNPIQITQKESLKYLLDLSNSSKLNDKNMTWFHSYCIHTASSIKRKEIIKALQLLNIEVFGDPQGWHDMIGPNLITHPDVDYRTGISSVYNAIDININITSCQMPTAINQRVFDIPLSKSFVINDKQDDLFTLFSTDEIVWYESIEDLKDKIDFFKKHPTERENLIQKACERILKEHTYQHRLEKFLSILK